MIKFFFILFFFLISIFYPAGVFAQTNSFVSIVNPVRGTDFWDLENQKIEDAVFGQIEILKKYNLNSTWLIRFDALDNKVVIDALKDLKHEKGLFLEITPTWAKATQVNYRHSSSWHNAGSAFFSGYELGEREKLIDSAFEKFKSIFGYYPKSVGAWWIDAYSLNYMQQKYQIDSALIVADQYTTDDYQIWGQYWSTPYYPSKNNVLHPSQSKENKIPVVITQWASRDPVNGYGRGVEESTFSVQANDYIDYHNLDKGYFEKLINIYTKQKLNQFGFLVVGLENSYKWNKYKGEYENQIQILSKKHSTDNLSIVTLEEFALWYKKTFPDISPAQIIVADDPVESFKKSVWFMNPYFRAGWFLNSDGSLFRDIRQYLEGEEELCFRQRCDEINFATFATRVLDEVSFGHKWVLDEGEITDFKVLKSGDNFAISYKNAGGRERKIEFLPRDIKLDEKISSIDGVILDATINQLESKKEKKEFSRGFFEWSPTSIIFKVIKFFAFLIIGCFIPGFFLTARLLDRQTPILKKFTVGIVLGFAVLTLLFYLLSLLGLKQLVFLYLAFNLLLLFKNYKNIFHLIPISFKSRYNFLVACLILTGTIFQQLPTFKNGLSFPYGFGFWGPNTHDGIWHISLINQLVKGVPPQNPIFAGEILKNYHYFYDLLIAATVYISAIPIIDLVFRFYPIIFSLILGIGSFYLIQMLFREKLNDLHFKIATLFSLYAIYFAGSFGWIVEYLKTKSLSGESAFWANQSISFNLNPPFAVSLIIIIVILLLLPSLNKFNTRSIAVLTMLSGVLIVFKSYAGILILFSLLIVGILKQSFVYLMIFLTSLSISSILFLSNFSLNDKLIIFSPFWFVHSMIDSPDRVGWVRLSLARVSGYESGNWFKFLSAEAIGLVIFLIGNLGTRFFALFTLLRIKTIFQKMEYLFLFIFSAIAFVIPILFIQTGNPWNTIQFIYYFLYVASLVSGVVVSQIFRLNKIIALIFIVTFIIITPINSWSSANGYLSYQPHALISKEEIEALNFLKKQDEGIVLTYPYDERIKRRIEEPWPLFVYDSTAYVSALSGKRSFIEDEPQNQILLTGYKKRVVSSKDFFASQNEKENEFLKKNNIRYIYLPKIYNKILEKKVLNIKKVFENNEVIILRVE